MKKIELSTWDRKEHYLFFRALDVPQYDMTFQIDITPLYKYVKTSQISFYFTMMHTVMKTINTIDAFKYRIIDNEVYMCDVMHPSFTDKMSNSTLFKMVMTQMEDDLAEFIKNARKNSDLQSTLIDPEKEKRPDLIYVTSFPWASYIAATNAVNIDPTDAIPRVSWGAYYEENTKIKIPFTLRVHHGFIDGYHVGIFLEKLQVNINKFLKM